MSKSFNAGTGPLPVIGRVLLALPFLLSGVGKLAAPEATQGYIASTSVPLPVIAYALAVIAEVGGGAMLLLGYRARLAALGLAVFSIAAALIFHHSLGDQNQFIHFMKNVMIAGGLLQIVAFGAGSFSLDNRSAARTGVLRSA
ncbi:MAG TPA: DoxX family protein [Ramlibacter sp.]|uniref:DoxX family protein n=1 Tax=Ramlibacter sp. TaxID=1917967 RepID=UPI002C8AC144|nr:DoxX family protein [Ramlibacter sp.]HVZ45766.1 DoxX family protein [Ramlibacter sp.]